MLRKLLLSISILCLSLVVFGCEKKAGQTKPQAQPQAQPNILLILVDTLRADHLGSYGYKRKTSPNIDALAAKSVVFEKAYSHSPWTMPSVASLFTSLTPRDHGIVNWRQPLDKNLLTLAEHLQTQGYDTEAYVSHIIFKQKYNFNQGFAKYDYSVLKKGKSKEISSSKEITDLGIAAIKRPHDKPFFLWLHYFDPHNNYLPHAKYDFGKKLIDLYDGEIAFTDEHIGRFLDALAAQGLMDNTIIVFMADHGEEFQDHGGRYHSGTLYEEVIRIPLIIYAKGLKPARIKKAVVESDIAPTVLAMAGLPIPAQFQGKPIPMEDGAFAPKVNTTVFAETFRFAKKQGVLHNDWKLIFDYKKDLVLLFDLNSDPKEKKNVIEQNKPIRDKLEALFKEHHDAKTKKVPKEQELSTELKDELKGLGYL